MIKAVVKPRDRRTTPVGVKTLSHLKRPHVPEKHDSAVRRLAWIRQWVEKRRVLLIYLDEVDRNVFWLMWF